MPMYSGTYSVMAANAIMHDIFVLGGYVANQRKYYKGLAFSSHLKQAAENICDEIINRRFCNIDNDIHRFANIPFIIDVSGVSSKKYKLDSEAIAKAIVYFAMRINAYWDDSLKTPYEIAEFEKTILGAAVKRYNMYLTTAGSNKTKASGGASNPYANNKSADARAIMTQACGKVYVDANSVVYRICGKSTSTKGATPYVLVKPFNQSKSCEVNGKNAVFFNASRGYDSCHCYFDDQKDAQAFLDNIIAANRIPSDVIDVKIVKNRPAARGYFIVDTEFGPCGVLAEKLNENLLDKVEEGFDWSNIMKNADNNELAEISKWARRG